MIPISTVRIDDEIEKEVLAVLRSGMIAQGPRVAEFESIFSKICGVKHAIAVNNGTTALIAALRMIEAPAGSTVVTSPFTFVATINAAIEAGYRVRFADIDPDTFNVTPSTLVDADDGNVSVVMPVHLYGQCADMTQIQKLATERSWRIVEDAAQAHGSTHGGRAAGSFGVGCFSFYATKNITTGEGGIVTTNDDELADRIRIYRNQGMRQRYQYEMPGTNFRMTDIQAAIGIPQLKRIEDINRKRQKNAKILTEMLDGLAGVITPVVGERNEHVWHQYTIRITSESSKSRDDVLKAIQDDGVGSGIYYPHLAHDYDCFRSNPNISVTETPIARQIVDEVISLPVHQYLSDADLQTISSAVRRAVC
jgi:dTDP-4-amino-4,6-dideoxygalactose transaminase